MGNRELIVVFIIALLAAIAADFLLLGPGIYSNDRTFYYDACALTPQQVIEYCTHLNTGYTVVVFLSMASYVIDPYWLLKIGPSFLTAALFVACLKLLSELHVERVLNIRASTIFAIYSFLQLQRGLMIKGELAMLFIVVGLIYLNRTLNGKKDLWVVVASFILVGVTHVTTLMFVLFTIPIALMHFYKGKHLILVAATALVALLVTLFLTSGMIAEQLFPASYCNTNSYLRYTFVTLLVVACLYAGTKKTKIGGIMLAFSLSGVLMETLLINCLWGERFLIFSILISTLLCAYLLDRAYKQHKDSELWVIWKWVLMVCGFYLLYSFYFLVLRAIMDTFFSF